MRPPRTATAWSLSTPRGATGTTCRAQIRESMDSIGGLSARTPTKNPAGAGFSAGSWWRLLAHALELDVHAAVLLAAFRGLVGRDRLRLALADGDDLRGRDA